MRISVSNNTHSIKLLLEKVFKTVDNIEHIGDYKFKAKVWSSNIIIYTEPTGDDIIDIVDIRFEDAD